MPNQPEQLRLLLRRFADDQASDTEIIEMIRLLREDEDSIALEQFLEEIRSEQQGIMPPGSDRERIWLQIQAQLAAAAPVRRMGWKKWLVAASVVLIVVAGYWLLTERRSVDRLPAVAKQENIDIPAPDKNRAMILLSDGRVVYLDSAGNGELATQEGVKLVKNGDGAIAYSGTTATGVSGTSYNTLSNPRGSRVIDMTLNDGSRVWLNAGSSIRFPVAFAGDERRVSITGEAYFEVAHSATKPFYVSKGEMEVKVLGTKFNVNAYEDEKDIRVTLLEGSVKVNRQMHEDKAVVLKPGEQAVVNTKYEVSSTNLADTEAVMAWKNGRFYFKGTGIEEIMRQVSRWYDVEIVYERKPAMQHFRGGISRDADVSKLLKILEATETVHFRIEGRKVFVMK